MRAQIESTLDGIRGREDEYECEIAFFGGSFTGIPRDELTALLANKMQTETTTSEIGDMVLMGLKKLDHVAYVRFASVYKDFSDVDSFIQIITELSDKKK